MGQLKQDTTPSKLGDDASAKEEARTLVSPTSLASKHESAAHHSETPVRLSSAPRRCVSKELHEQLLTLEMTVHLSKSRDQERIGPRPFGCFGLMHLIEQSIQVGAFFSPKLFVPKEIWHQDQVKLARVPLKLAMCHRLKDGLEKASHALSMSSETTKATGFVNELDALLEFTRQERVHLVRSFPFLLQNKSNHAIELMRRRSSNGADAGTADANSLNIGKLTDLAFGFGRMVKKQAIAAVERVGAAPSVLVSINELDEYAAVLCMFFNSTRCIENHLRAHLDGTQGLVNAHKAKTERSHLNSATLKKLEDFATFLDEVVIELVMRDVYSLLEIYLQRLTQQFGEFTVEQALLKRRSSVST